MTVVHEVASILLVEDDAATRQAIATYLGGHAHEVVQAGDAASALDAWAARRSSSCLPAIANQTRSPPSIWARTTT